MIVFGLEENISYAEKITENREQIFILGSAVLFIRHEGRWLIRLPGNLVFISKNIIENDSEIRIGEKDGSAAARLFFSGFDEGFEKFGRYRYPDGEFTVGGSIEDDIYIQSSHVEKYQYRISRLDHTITCTCGSGILSCGGKTVSGIMSYADGDLLLIMNCRIILHRDFILINRCANTYHALDEYRNSSSFYQPQAESMPVVYVHGSVPETRQVITAEEPPVPAVYHERPFLLMIGPPVMMASASMLNGILAAMRIYENGGSLRDFLPGILMPAVMLLSYLLFQPLQVFADRRNTAKENSRRTGEYIGYLHELGRDAQRFREAYRKAASDYLSRREDIRCFHDSRNIYLYAGESEEAVSQNIQYDIHRNPDPRIRDEMDLLVKKISEKDYLLVFIDLQKYSSINFDVDEEYFLHILGQLTGMYDPNELCIMILMSADNTGLYRKFRNIPHLFTESGSRLVCMTHEDVKAAEEILHTEQRRIILVQAYTKLHCEDESISCRLTFGKGEGRYDLHVDQAGNVFTAEGVDGFSMKFICDSRMIYGIPAIADAIPHHAVNSGQVSFLDLYDATDSSNLDISGRWMTSDPDRGIICPIGIDGSGRTIYLDLHENGNGPHGLIAGTTGSGKSELIISLVLSLAVSYAPDVLQFVLIDFKGGGIVNAMKGRNGMLPHIAGVLSDLDVDEMKRALVSFRNECRKRELLFRSLSAETDMPVLKAADYRKYRTGKFPVLADLVIIVDEFAELKQEKPEFMQELISIARVGRSLGIHMILATQKPGGVVNEQIWANCRFKLCLKVSERQDSVEMIQIPDAASLRRPGDFYLLCDGMISRGRSGYVNAPVGSGYDSVEIYDHMLRVKDANEYHRKNQKPQISSVLDEISLCAKEYPAPPKLWHDPLAWFGRERIDREKGYAVGFIDDYRNNRQPPADLMPERYNVQFILSPRYEEKLGFFMVLVYVLIREADPETVIYIIDDYDHAVCRILSECGTVADIIRSEDEEKTANLFRILNGRNRNTPGTAFLIINDLSHFLSARDADRSYLHELMEHADACRVCIFLFGSASGDLGYREMAFIRQKYALRNENEQEIQLFFESREKKSVRKKMHGLINGKYLNEFRYAEITESDIAACIDTADSRNGICHSQIPCMPEKVIMNTDEEMLLGIRKNEYTRVYRDPERKLLIMSEFIEEMKVYIGYCDAAGIVYEIEPENTDCSLIFMTSDHFRHAGMRDVLRERDILFIGKGFNEQYFLKCRIRNITEKEAVYMHQNESEVLRIADEIGKDPGDR